MNIHLPAAAGFIVAACLTSLTGCSGAASFPDPGTGTATNAGSNVVPALRGIAHGGQQPIAGARVYLLAAGTTGYGSAATSLLTSKSYSGYPAKQDANGWYVNTDSSGSFQIVDSCTPGQEVYLASIGGDPGAGANSAANEIALLGTCPAAGNFDTLTGVYVSEISTIAAAYSAAAYARDAFHIGSPNTLLAKTGMANAFANAANLFDVQTLNDLARTNTLDGVGVVPQARVHTLANLLASCVNSIGPASPSCTTLFTNAPLAGNSGTVPTDVTTAAINMAHNPWANVGALYGLQGPTTPFAPQLKTVPADLALPLLFPTGALAKNPSLAIDTGGDVWTVAPNATAVAEVSPLGAVLSTAAGFPIGGGFAKARALAFDTSGNLWVLGQGSFGLLNTPAATFAELNSSGSYLQILNDAGMLNLSTEPPAAVTNLAIDGTGAMYFGGVQTGLLNSQSTTCCTVKFTPSTSTTIELNPGKTTPGTNFIALNGTGAWVTSGNATLDQTVNGTSTNMIGGGLNAANGVALDHSGNIWVANSGSNSVSEFSSGGTALSGSMGYTGGGAATPVAIAIDGAAKVWVANAGNGSVSEFTSAGVPVGNGFAVAPGLTTPGALAIDPSGNIWVTDAMSTSLTEYMGLASPVVTPLASAVATNSLGMEP